MEGGNPSWVRNLLARVLSFSGEPAQYFLGEVIRRESQLQISNHSCERQGFVSYP